MVIVIIPMVAVALVLFQLVSRSEQGQVDAQLSGAQLEALTVPSAQATAPFASQYADSGWVWSPGPDEQLSMHYFDSRGVYRVYAVSLSEGIWSFSRDAPAFSQRFTGTFSDDGNTITGRSKLSRDGSTWDDDLAITFRRR